MTRDEAKRLFDKCKSDFIVDKIYDYFKTRTCKNCKYFTSSPNTNKYDCCEKGISDASISFCCNKWEAK